MKRWTNNSPAYVVRPLLRIFVFIFGFALIILAFSHSLTASGAKVHQHGARWIGTWATAAQPAAPGAVKTFSNQSVRLIVHTSAGGKQVRIRISNTYGNHPLMIGGAHVARRTSEAEIDPSSDRTLTFNGRLSVAVPEHGMVVSDPVDLDVPALSDLAVSLFLPESTEATTSHILAMQTNYISADTGDSTAAAKFPVGKTMRSWPFLTGVDVAASSRGTTIVAFGSSLTDGDGSTLDTNSRWPDVLSERLQKNEPKAEVGVLNLGIIGNRLLDDSPDQPENPFGKALGEAGLARFERDVLSQSSVQYVIVGLGINDILFPGSLTPAEKKISAENVISGYRQLIAKAHAKGVRVIGTTNPPVEDAFLALSKTEPPITFYTPEKEQIRQQVNDWIRSSKAFDAVIDFDEVLRDPSHPTRLLPAYDSGDHLHPNNAGCVAEGKAVPLTLFKGLKRK